MRPPGTSQQLERRRRHAIHLLDSGRHLSAVARQVQCAKSSVSRWWAAYKRGGAKGLQARPIPGRPCRLSPAQKRTLASRLLKGALAEGYHTDLWTLERIAQLIHKQFRVRYHPHHVWWLLRGMGWSCQKPERRALQRDERAIARWKQARWPHIKKR